MFFFMFARHSRSGRPVVPDCARTNSSGVCEPSPIGQLGVRVELSGPCPRARISSAIGISRSTSRARCALRMSRWMSPPLARLTFAIGSPVEKWRSSSNPGSNTAVPTGARKVSSWRSASIRRQLNTNGYTGYRRP